MEDNANISLETADCLVRKSAFGHDVIHNICTGTVKSIPWEFGDWMLAGFMGLLGLFMIVVAGFVVRLIFSDI